VLPDQRLVITVIAEPQPTVTLSRIGGPPAKLHVDYPPIE
jgi:hypothetical protein